jgi:hypothetical protein
MILKDEIGKKILIKKKKIKLTGLTCQISPSDLEFVLNNKIKKININK